MDNLVPYHDLYIPVKLSTTIHCTKYAPATIPWVTIMLIFVLRTTRALSIFKPVSYSRFIAYVIIGGLWGTGNFLMLLNFKSRHADPVWIPVRVARGLPTDRYVQVRLTSCMKEIFICVLQDVTECILNVTEGKMKNRTHHILFWCDKIISIRIGRIKMYFIFICKQKTYGISLSPAPFFFPSLVSLSFMPSSCHCTFHLKFATEYFFNATICSVVYISEQINDPFAFGVWPLALLLSLHTDRFELSEYEFF